MTSASSDNLRQHLSHMKPELLNIFIKPQDGDIKKTFIARVSRFGYAITHIYDKKDKQFHWNWITNKDVAQAIQLKTKNLADITTNLLRGRADNAQTNIADVKTEFMKVHNVFQNLIPTSSNDEQYNEIVESTEETFLNLDSTLNYPARERELKLLEEKFERDPADTSINDSFISVFGQHPVIKQNDHDSDVFERVKALQNKLAVVRDAQILKGDVDEIYQLSRKVSKPGVEFGDCITTIDLLKNIQTKEQQITQAMKSSDKFMTKFKPTQDSIANVDSFLKNDKNFVETIYSEIAKKPIDNNASIRDIRNMQTILEFLKNSDQLDARQKATLQAIDLLCNNVLAQFK